MQAIAWIIKAKWSEGLKKFMKLQRVKQLVASINDSKSFLEFIDYVIRIVFIENKDTGMKNDFLECLEYSPYIFTKIIVGLYIQLPLSVIQGLVPKINSLPFYKREITEIFDQFDPLS